MVAFAWLVTARLVLVPGHHCDRADSIPTIDIRRKGDPPLMRTQSRQICRAALILLVGGVVVFVGTLPLFATTKFGTPTPILENCSLPEGSQIRLPAELPTFFVPSGLMGDGEGDVAAKHLKIEDVAADVM